MKALLEYLVTNLVTKPNDVVIDEHESDYGYVDIKINVAPEDMGKIIGKRGKIIDAVRKLAKVRAVHIGKRVHINLAEPEEQAPE